MRKLKFSGAVFFIISTIKAITDFSARFSIACNIYGTSIAALVKTLPLYRRKSLGLVATFLNPYNHRLFMMIQNQSFFLKPPEKIN